MVALVNKTEEHQLPEGYNLRKLELSDYFNGKMIIINPAYLIFGFLRIL